MLFSIFNVAVFIYDQKGRTGIDRLRFVLYHACMDPWSQWSTPLVTVMPLSQFLLYGMNILNISCNFYLYLYLEDQRKNNTGEEILAYFRISLWWSGREGVQPKYNFFPEGKFFKRTFNSSLNP